MQRRAIFISREGREEEVFQEGKYRWESGRFDTAAEDESKFQGVLKDQWNCHVNMGRDEGLHFQCKTSTGQKKDEALAQA